MRSQPSPGDGFARLFRLNVDEIKRLKQRVSEHGRKLTLLEGGAVLPGDGGGGGGGGEDVYIEDSLSPGTYEGGSLYIGATDPAVGGDEPYAWIDPSELGGGGGGGSPVNYPYAYVRRSTGQNIAAAGAYIIFDFIGRDTHGGHNTANGIYTVPEAGIYTLSWQIRYAGTAGGNFRGGQLVISGTSRAIQTHRPVDASGAQVISSAVTIELAAGDTVRTFANPDVVVLAEGGVNTYMTVAKVAPAPAGARPAPEEGPPRAEPRGGVRGP